MSTSNSPGAVATAVADRARGRGEDLADLLPLMRAYYHFYGCPLRTQCLRDSPRFGEYYARVAP